jgi:N-acetylmuramoyl-L-alanine amidase
MIGRVIISIGHGAGDPGAVNSRGDKENTEVTQIAALLMPKLKAAGIKAVLIPDIGYVPSIQMVNQMYQPGDWAIELHKDSFGNYNPNTMRRRCGAYYFHKSVMGKQVAEILKTEFIRNGAHMTSWARPDNFSNHGGLGWNSMTRPLAHILELGFMQDSTGPQDDEFYAEVTARGIIKVVEDF